MFRSNCLGQVIVWESRQMEYELNEYFDVLQTGFKP